jgi:hypothetical protein
MEEIHIRIYEDDNGKVTDEVTDRNGNPLPKLLETDPRYARCMAAKDNWTRTADWGPCSPVCVWYNGSLYCT